MYTLAEILKGRPNPVQDNDIKILRSFVEYKHGVDKMEYIIIEMEVKDRDGKPIHLFKAIKFYRIIKLPDALKQSLSMMDIQSQILASFWENQINFISMIARIEDCGTDTAIGLMQLFGVQGIAKTIHEAKQIADADFWGLTSSLQGSYRTLEFRVLNSKEAEWMREKMANMKYIQVIRGIPRARKGGSERAVKGMGGNDDTPESEETSEQFAMGMAQHEFVSMTLSSPIEYDVLENWLSQTTKKQSYWASIMQGSNSMSAGINIPIVFAANLGSSMGENESVSDSTSEGFSTNESTSTTVSNSVSHSQGVSEGISVGNSENYGENVGVSHNEGESASYSLGHTEGTSYGESQNVSLSESYSKGISENFGSSNNIGWSQGEGTSSSTGFTSSQSVGISDGASNGYTDSVSQSFGDSRTSSLGTGLSSTLSEGQNQSLTSTGSHSQNQGLSDSISNSYGSGINSSHSDGSSQGLTDTKTVGNSHTIGDSGSVSASGTAGISVGVNGSVGLLGTGVGASATGSGSMSAGATHTTSESSGATMSNASGVTQGTSQTDSFGNSFNQSVSGSSGVTSGQGYSSSEGLSQGSSATASNGMTGSVSNGLTQSATNGASQGINNSWSQGVNNSWSQGTTSSSGVSNSKGTSAGMGTNYGQGINESWSSGISKGYGVSRGVSSSDSETVSSGKTVGDGWNQGASYGNSRSQTNTGSVSQTISESKSVSQGVSRGTGTNWGRSIGSSQGTSMSLSQGLSSSMGVGASIGVGKNYQFIDKEVENIVELLEFQKLRLKTAIHGGTGAFFVDMYIATETSEAKHAAKTAAKFAWYDEGAMICPLQVMEIDEQENEHLLYHFNAFSACTKKEMDKFGELESYRYTTILNSDELTAYTHIIRLSDGGIYADIQNIPELSVPSEMEGEIYIGKILSGYRWTPESGYKTKFDYRVSEKTLMHGIICGGSRSGKSVSALRFAAEVANHVVRGPKRKRMRIIAMDPKYDWRKLSRYVEAERFRIYSMGDPKKFPFKLNPMKVPMGVDPEFHLDTLIDVFCRAYGLGVRSVTILLDILKTLYDREGVFDTEDPVEITERSSRVTIADAYKLLNTKKENKEFGRDKSDAVDKVLDRLSRYAWENGVLYKLYCQPDGMSIDEILGDDDVVVLESGKIQSNNMAFIFGFISASIYMYAKYLPDYFLGENQFETCLFIEEANRVLTGDNGDGNNGGIQGQSIFEEMLDQAAGMGLFVYSITQQPSLMPTSILANSGLILAHKLTLEDDINAIITAVGREARYDDRPLKKFFPKMPIGWAVAKNSRGFDYKEAEPILINADPLDVEKPSDEELIHQMELYKLKKDSQMIYKQVSEIEDVDYGYLDKDEQNN